MFGLSVFSRAALAVLMVLLLVCGFGHAAPKYTGRVKVDAAIVYKDPDFDSAVLGQVAGNKVIEISKKIFGAFRRVRIGTVIGYVSDADVQPLNFKESKKSTEAKENSKLEIKNPKKKYALEQTRYLGINISSSQYSEDTLGSKRSEALVFYGLKISGPNVLVSGNLPSEFNFDFHSGAPSYYETLTGQAAGGFLFRMDFQFQSLWTLDKNSLAYFGWGPGFRYSRFDVTLTDPTTLKTNNYSAEDMTLGLNLSLGVVARWRNFALRPEFKYYWEKTQYTAFAVALQKEF